MEKKDLLTFLATFLFGVFTGGYLYYIGWAPQMNDLTTPRPDSNGALVGDELEIVGEQYGACSSSPTGCPQFRISESREYRIVWIDENGSVIDSQEGRISRQDWQIFADTFSSSYENGNLVRLADQSTQCVGSPTSWMYSASLSTEEQWSFDECVTEDYELIDELVRLRQLVME